MVVNHSVGSGTGAGVSGRAISPAPPCFVKGYFCVCVFPSKGLIAYLKVRKLILCSLGSQRKTVGFQCEPFNTVASASACK